MKLSFADLAKRNNELANQDILSSISGGTENSCHVVTSDNGDTITIYGPTSGTIIIK